MTLGMASQNHLCMHAYMTSQITKSLKHRYVYAYIYTSILFTKTLIYIISDFD